jgi:hypothetical protein
MPQHMNKNAVFSQRFTSTMRYAATQIAKLIRFYFEHEWKRRLGPDNPNTADFKVDAKNLPAISLTGPLQVRTRIQNMSLYTELGC